MTTASAAETERLGEELAQTLGPGDVVAFTGGLGAGKTAFVRGLARGLGYSGGVTSPTFALINEYRGGRLALCHLDAYRLTGGDDLLDIGFFDYLDSGWTAAVEWSERVQDALSPAVWVDIARLDDTRRDITIREASPC